VILREKTHCKHDAMPSSILCDVKEMIIGFNDLMGYE
jgi:hypothetical protein